MAGAPARPLLHYVLTRFCLRDFRSTSRSSAARGDLPDPLAPARLEHRMRLLELVAVPSLAGQTEQRFEWVVIADPALPPASRARLRELLARRAPARIVDLRPSIDPAGLDWLDAERSDATIATTLLDDDDALPTTFIASLRETIEARVARPSAALMGLAGASRIVQWDLQPSPLAPLGWLAPWHRGVACASAGLTLHVRSPEARFSVLGVRHRYATAWFDPAQPAFDAAMSSMRSAAAATGPDGTVRDAPAFEDVSERCGPVLMTNHAGNVQVSRLAEPKPGRRPATREDFDRYSIDAGAFERSAHRFAAARTGSRGTGPAV